MSLPDWLLGILAGVSQLVALLGAGYLAVTRAWNRPATVDADVAFSHLPMGIALAGILVARLETLPNAIWAVVFAVMAAWFDWRLWQQSREYGAAAALRGPYAPHLVYSAAMLYLFIALPKPALAGSGMSGMSSSMPGMAGGSSSALPTSRAPTLAFVFAVLLIALTVRDLDQRASADTYFPLATRVSKGCQVALGVTMAFTLIIMI